MGLYKPLKQYIVYDSASCQSGKVTKPKVSGWKGPYGMDQFPRVGLDESLVFSLVDVSWH